MRVAPEIQSWREGPTSRGSPYCVSCIFEALAKLKKMGVWKCRKRKRPLPDKYFVQMSGFMTELDACMFAVLCDTLVWTVLCAVG